MAALTNRGPQFTPASGVGSVYEDPKTKKKWRYTSAGWQQMSTDVGKEAKESGSFNIEPAEEGLAEQLRAGGADDEQIKVAVQERRRVLSNVGQQEPTLPESVKQPDKNNPFGGMTKQQMLRDAFNNGVTSKSELEELSGLYDLLTEEEEMSFDDFSKLTPEEQQKFKGQLKTDVALRAQELGSATERQGVLGTLATFETGDEIVGILEGKDVTTGPVVGRYRRGVFGIGARSADRTSAEEDYFNALTETFAAEFRKAMSGTAVSEPEMERLEQFLPSETKQEQDNIEGIRALSNYLANKHSYTVGVDLNPLKPGIQTQEKEDDDPLKLGGSGTGNNPLGI